MLKSIMHIDHQSSGRIGLLAQQTTSTTSAFSQFNSFPLAVSFCVCSAIATRKLRAYDWSFQLRALKTFERTGGRRNSFSGSGEESQVSHKKNFQLLWTPFLYCVINTYFIFLLFSFQSLLRYLVVHFGSYSAFMQSKRKICTTGFFAN